MKLTTLSSGSLELFPKSKISLKSLRTLYSSYLNIPESFLRMNKRSGVFLDLPGGSEDLDMVLIELSRHIQEDSKEKICNRFIQLKNIENVRDPISSLYRITKMILDSSQYCIKEKLAEELPFLLCLILSETGTKTRDKSKKESEFNSEKFIRLVSSLQIDEEMLGGSLIKFYLITSLMLVQHFPIYKKKRKKEENLKTALMVFKPIKYYMEFIPDCIRFYERIKNKTESRELITFFKTKHLILSIFASSDKAITHRRIEELYKIRNEKDVYSKLACLVSIKELLNRNFDSEIKSDLKNKLIYLCDHESIRSSALKVCYEMELEGDFQFNCAFEEFLVERKQFFLQKPSVVCRNLLLNKNSISNYLKEYNKHDNFYHGVSEKSVYIALQKYESLLASTNKKYVKLSVNKTYVDSKDRLINIEVKKFLEKPQKRVLVIVGEKGSGKTLFCRRLVRLLLKEKQTYLPFLFEISKDNGLKYFPKRCFKDYYCDANLLRNRHTLFIIDGLKKPLSNLTESKNLFKLNPKSKLIITTEEYDTKDIRFFVPCHEDIPVYNELDFLYIKPFDADQIHVFIQKNGEYEQNCADVEDLMKYGINTPFYLHIYLQTKIIGHRFDIISAYHDKIIGELNSKDEMDVKSQKSYKDFVVALKIKEVLMNPISVNAVETSKLNKTILNSSILSFIESYISSDHQESLFQIIMLSKRSNNLKVAVNNAFAILRHSNYDFIRKELSFSNCTSSDLRSLDLSDSIFFKADLRNTKLNQSILIKTDFTNANLLGSRFLEYQNRLEERSTVEGISISPDKKLVATAKIDCEVSVWEISSYNEKYLFRHHTNVVFAVAFSHDGKYLLSGGADNWDLLKNLETFALKYAKNDHTSAITAVVFSHDDKFFASGSQDMNIKIYEFHTGALQHSIEIHEDHVLSLCFSSDNKFLISSAADNFVIVHDLQDKSFQVLQGHSLPVNSVAVYRNIVASGSDDKSVKIWDLKNYSLYHTFVEHGLAITVVAFALDGRFIASGSEDMNIFIWDIRAKEIFQILNGHTGCIYSLDFADSFFVSGGEDQLIIFWDIDFSQKLIPGYLGHIFSVCFSDDQNLIATTSADHNVKVWDFYTKKLKYNLIGHTEIVYVTVFYGLDTVVSGSQDTNIKIWDLKTNSCTRTLEEHGGCVRSIAISQSGLFMASGSWDYSVVLWSLPLMSVLFRFNGHFQGVHSVVFSPDEKHLFSSSADSKIVMWDTQTGTQVNTIDTNAQTVWCVDISKDGKYLASAQQALIVNVWDLRNLQLLWTLCGHEDEVYAVIFSEKFLISGGRDQYIIIWDFMNGTRIRTLDGKFNSIIRFSLSRDERFLVSGGYRFKIWDLKYVDAPFRSHSIKEKSIV